PRRARLPRLFPYTTLFRSGLLLARQMALDRLERAHGPVREPAVARRLVLAHFLLQVISYPRHNQRMPIRRGDQREPAHPRAAARDRKSTRLNSSHQIISYA